MRIIVLLAAACLAPALARAQFTLEQIMGAPFVSELTAAPQGNRAGDSAGDGRRTGNPDRIHRSRAAAERA